MTDHEFLIHKYVAVNHRSCFVIHVTKVAIRPLSRGNVFV